MIKGTPAGLLWRQRNDIKCLPHTQPTVLPSLSRLRLGKWLRKLMWKN